MDTKYLRLPLYWLYYIDDLNNFDGFSHKEWDDLSEKYSEEKVINIYNSIKWIVQNKEYNFASLLPDLPYNNKQIHEIFCRMDASLKAYEKHQEL